MPAFVNSRVGSFPGTRGLDGTTVWPCSRKNSRKAVRTSAAFVNEALLKFMNLCRNRRQWLLGYDPMKSHDTAKSELGAFFQLTLLVFPYQICVAGPRTPASASPARYPERSLPGDPALPPHATQPQSAAVHSLAQRGRQHNARRTGHRRARAPG